MKRFAPFALALLALALLFTVPTWAAAGKDELTLSGTYVRPNDERAAWTFTSEYLIAAGKYFVLGPSFTLFDGPDVDGNAVGGAIEWNTTGLSGLFFGAAVHAIGGDAGDVADYSGEARVGFKVGTGTGFFKAYLSRTWTQDATGDIASPDRTDAVVGLGLRF